MLKRWWQKICWYYRNLDAIQKLERKADDRKLSLYKHYYCKLHGSMDCSHSTWSSAYYRRECAAIDKWLKEELAKLP